MSDLPRPLLLRADNFTPATRTPWGGRRIVEFYKRGLLEHPPDSVVGESWEVSVEPSFPSVVAESGRSLRDVIARDPVGWLGAGAIAKYGPMSPILVKLLDAADNLSVQVHPAPDDPALGPDESGKPESWYILEAEPGAGLYLGFRDGVGRTDVEECLRSRGALDELMNFVEVHPGEMYVLDAGTVHAIGAGVTLVEPQLVTPGRRGLTYRFWDWNRLYDATGKRASNGSPRELHIRRSLAVTSWDKPRGKAFVEQCRSTPIDLVSVAGCTRSQLLAWEFFTVERLTGVGEQDLGDIDAMLAVTCVGGTATLSSDRGDAVIAMGQSAVVPASVEASIELDSATVLVTYANGTRTLRPQCDNAPGS